MGTMKHDFNTAMEQVAADYPYQKVMDTVLANYPGFLKVIEQAAELLAQSWANEAVKEIEIAMQKTLVDVESDLKDGYARPFKTDDNSEHNYFKGYKQCLIEHLNFIKRMRDVDLAEKLDKALPYPEAL